MRETSLKRDCLPRFLNGAMPGKESEGKNLKYYTQRFVPEYTITMTPMGMSGGYPVRPGLFDVNGAMALPNGVSFTVHTHFGTSCESCT